MRINIILFSVFVIALSGIAVSGGSQEFEIPDDIRAVSLRVLQDQIESYGSISDCPHTLKRLCGLNTIEGYVLDRDNNDLIIFGQLGSPLFTLATEDLIVALRSAWHKYTRQEGDTIYYSNPGCSIDPDPSVFKRLDEIMEEFETCESDVEREDILREWITTCRQPQSVRIFGVPVTSRFAEVMVDADYYMKKLVDGSTKVKIDGFKSLTQMVLDSLISSAQQNKPSLIPARSLNRFWFYPGEYEFFEDEDMIFLNRCDVMLLTEEEYLSKGGNIQGTGKPNPFAKQFAKSFSQHYSEIAYLKPIYRKLEGLFRFVAVAKMAKSRNVDQIVDLDYFLSRCKVEEIEIPTTLKGIATVERFEQPPTSTKDGYILQIPSCGGVSIDVESYDADIYRSEDEELTEYKSKVLDARPSRRSLSWDV